MGVTRCAGGSFGDELAGCVQTSAGTGWNGGDSELLMVADRYRVVLFLGIRWLPGDLGWVFHGSLYWTVVICQTLRRLRRHVVVIISVSGAWIDIL